MFRYPRLLPDVLSLTHTVLSALLVPFSVLFSKAFEALKK